MVSAPRGLCDEPPASCVKRDEREDERKWLAVGRKPFRRSNPTVVIFNDRNAERYCLLTTDYCLLYLDEPFAHEMTLAADADGGDLFAPALDS